MATPGHLFIVDGDLTRLVCDAVLVPSDRGLRITPRWRAALGLAPDECRLPADVTPPAGWVDAVRCFQLRPGGPRSPAIWIGAVGHSNRPPEWYADGAAEFVAAYAKDAERPAGPPPRVAVHVVGTGAGGMAGRKGAVYAVLVERLAKAASDVGVDVVLVAFGPVGYAAAQRARQKTPDAQRWDMGERSETLNAQAERLAGTAQRRDLVLFLGAGVSAGAGLPMWNALIEQLAAPLGMDASYRERLRALDVRDQALLVARKFQDDANYRSALADLVRSERHALAHALLAGLGAREAVTTNYDTLYEDACRSGGRKVAVLPYEPIGPEGRWVLKLHGDISRGDMVLTRADYLGLPERATALFGIVQAMLITKHMLFVGYSLADDTFHRLVDGVRRARRPAADGQGTRAAIGTAVQLFDDLLLQELWGDDLDFVFLAPQPPGGVDGPAIARAARLLDVFLDRVGFLAADVSSFLLDPTYADLLDEGEARMAEAVRTLLSAAGESDGPLQERLRDALEAFGGGTGEDRRQREQLPEEIACPQCKTRAKLQGYNYCSRTCATAAGRLRRGAMVEAPVHGQSEGEADLPEPKLPKK